MLRQSRRLRSVPQAEQRLLVGSNRSIPTAWRPYQAALYRAGRMNSDQPASSTAMALHVLHGPRFARDQLVFVHYTG